MMSLKQGLELDCCDDDDECGRSMCGLSCDLQGVGDQAPTPWQRIWNRESFEYGIQRSQAKVLGIILGIVSRKSINIVYYHNN